MEIYLSNEFNNMITNTHHKQCRYNVLVFDKIIYDDISDDLPLTIECNKCCIKCGKSKPKYKQIIKLDKTDYNLKKYNVDINKLQHNHVLIKKKYYCEIDNNNVNIIKTKSYSCSSYFKVCDEHINKSHKYKKYLTYCVAKNIIDITNSYVRYYLKIINNNVEIEYFIKNGLTEYIPIDNEILTLDNIDIEYYEIDMDIIKIYQTHSKDYIIQGYKYKNEYKKEILEFDKTTEIYLDCLKYCNDNNINDIIYDSHFSDTIININYNYNNRLLKCFISDIINIKQLTSFCDKCNNHTHSYIVKQHCYDSNDKMWDNSYKTWDETLKKCIVCDNVKDEYNDNYYYNENTYGCAIYRH